MKSENTHKILYCWISTIVWSVVIEHWTCHNIVRTRTQYLVVIFKQERESDRDNFPNFCWWQQPCRRQGLTPGWAPLLCFCLWSSGLVIMQQWVPRSACSGLQYNPKRQYQKIILSLLTKPFEVLPTIGIIGQLVWSRVLFFQIRSKFLWKNSYFWI